MRFVIAVFCLCTLAAVRTSAGVEPAPDWLRKAEVYNGWYKAWDDAAIAKMRGIPVVIGCPVDKETAAKAHKLGVRVLPYATFYQMPRKEKYQRAVLDEHPDWIVIGADGKEVKSCFDGSENTGWMALCPNSTTYCKFALAHVKYVMDQGVDGLFIDNAHPEVTCEGPKYGKHQHVYEGQNNIHAYRELLKAIRAEVKRYGPDKVVIVNPGNPRIEWVGVCDGQMLESYICTWAAKNRWNNETTLMDWQRAWAPVSRQGCVIVALSYVGNTSHTPREDAFYCYAWAKLSLFLWADWFTGERASASLYKVRLGDPDGGLLAIDGYYLRRFQRGIVVATPESRGATVPLDCKGKTKLYDVFAAKRLTPGPSGDFQVTLPPGQGRVYLFD